MVRGMKSSDFLFQIVKQRAVEKCAHADIETVAQLFDRYDAGVRRGSVDDIVTVDCVIPEMLLILLIVMFRSLHNSSSRFTVASAIVIQSSSYRNAVNKSVSKLPEKR